MAPGDLLTMQRSAVSSDGQSTPEQAAGRQAPDGAESDCITPGSAPCPDGVVGVQIDLLVFHALS